LTEKLRRPCAFFRRLNMHWQPEPAGASCFWEPTASNAAERNHSGCTLDINVRMT
jgi:hypothetical protein